MGIHMGILRTGFILLLCATFAGPARAGLEDEGRKLIEGMAEEVTGLLGRKDIDAAERERRLDAIFRRDFDVPTIGQWVMGPAWRQASEKQREEYLSLFERFVAKTYTVQLAQYTGETLRVTEVEEEGNGVIVSSEIVNPQRPNERPVSMKWRLRPIDGRLKVRDVVIENISMSLNQRREFAAVYQRRGSVDGLIAALRERIAELDEKL